MSGRLRAAAFAACPLPFFLYKIIHEKNAVSARKRFFGMKSRNYRGFAEMARNML